MNKMHRTQLLLPEKLWKALQRRAQREGRSASDLVREAALRYLAESPRNLDWNADPLDAIVGGVNSKHSDLSERHDDHLYGP